MNRLLPKIVLGLFLIIFAFGLIFQVQADAEPANTQGAVSLCGNGTLDTGETCDDGNTVSGDGCSSTCQTEEEEEVAPAPSVGGGGGVYIPPPVVTQVIFTGRAYPKSTITLLKDAQIAATAVADANADFQITLSGLSTGNYIFSVYAKDRQGKSSPLLVFPKSIVSGATIYIRDIFIPPTIVVDKEEVKKGDNIAIFGQAAPNSEISLIVNSDKGKEFFGKAKMDKDGVYFYNFNTVLLEIGRYSVKSQATLNGIISSVSKSVSFIVGTRNVPVEPLEKYPIRADLNNDYRVNLVDISILIYWFDKTPVPSRVDLNGDGKADLTDLSILAYYWTG